MALFTRVLGSMDFRTGMAGLLTAMETTMKVSLCPALFKATGNRPTLMGASTVERGTEISTMGME